MLFWVAGSMDYFCMVKQFPTEMLSAAVTVTHVFPVCCAVAAGANRITVAMEQYEYLCNR